MCREGLKSSLSIQQPLTLHLFSAEMFLMYTTYNLKYLVIKGLEQV